MSLFGQVLLALTTIIVAGRLLGVVCTRLGQPRVIGEVVAGILLGPTLLGRICPAAMEFVLPPAAMAPLGVLAQLGIVIYMFLVGVELNGAALRSRLGAATAIAQAGIVLPLLLGAALAWWLHERLAPAGVSQAVFALFLGVAMAITAFPVLARILTDLGIARSDLGLLALGAAAIGDVTAWCLLAFVLGVVQAGADQAVATAVLAAAFIGVMWLLVGPAARRWLQPADGSASFATLATVLLGMLAAALAAEAIGVHAVFGAFLFGVLIPHDSAAARSLTARLEDATSILLLPAFFAYTGMRTQIGLLADGHDWLICAAIIFAATAGKAGGVLLAARFCGLPWRSAAALGTLMNTRGLMELIVVNIGLDLGIISPTLHAMLVVMALATTLATTPIFLWISPGLRPTPE